MKRLFLLLVVGLFSIQNLFAFSEHTHRELTAIALNKCAVFRNSKIDNRLKSIILKNCSKGQDIDSSHFCGLIDNPLNLERLGRFDMESEYRNYRERYPESILVYLFEQYREAINYWKNKCYKDSMEHLGLAIRYMQDICCVVNPIGASQSQIDTYNRVIDRELFSGKNRLKLINKLRDRTGDRTPLCGDVRNFAINYLKRGLIMSDKSDSLIEYDLLQPIFDATCCLINSFCYECKIDVTWN
ncbi:MAG: hypothetical protein Q4B84_01535 [Clostridia bacterium]|nr:hypothetical protein [Clostridia bacterium]